MYYKYYLLNHLRPNVYKKKDEYENQKDEEACFWMSVIQNYDMRYYSGDITARHYENALLKIAESGYGLAWYYLAWCWDERPKMFGRVYVTANEQDEKVRFYYEKAIEEGVELANVSIGIYDIFGDYYRRSEKLPWQLVRGLKQLLICAQNDNPEAMYALSKILVNDIYQYGEKDWLVNLESIVMPQLSTYWAFKACLYCRGQEHASAIFRNAISFLIAWEWYGEAKFLYKSYVSQYGTLNLGFLEDEEAKKLQEAESEPFEMERMVAFIKEEIGNEFDTLINELFEKAKNLEDKWNEREV